MFYKLIMALIVTTLVVCSESAKADSFWGKLKDRVQNEVENVVSGKVSRKAGDHAGEATDTVLNPSFDKEESDDENETSERNHRVKQHQHAGNPLQGLGGMGGMLSSLQQEVTIEPRYEFDLSILAKQTHKGEESIINQRFSDSAFMVDAGDGSQIIMDISNKAIVMIDEKENTKTGISTQFIKQMTKMGGSRFQAGKAKPIGVVDIKSTGKSKKILGYIVKQWVFKNGKEKGEVWMTDEIDFDFIGFSQQLMTLFGSEQSQMMFDFSSLEGDYPRGLALESKTYRGRKLQSHFLVKDVSRKPKVVDTSVYKTQSLMQGN